eukprot:3017282-Rhodomonas_salina.1
MSMTFFDLALWCRLRAAALRQPQPSAVTIHGPDTEWQRLGKGLSAIGRLAEIPVSYASFLCSLRTRQIVVRGSVAFSESEQGRRSRGGYPSTFC